MIHPPRSRRRGAVRGCFLAASIAFALTLAAFVMVVIGFAKNTWAYDAALEAAQTDALVQAALGTPIEDGVGGSSQLSLNNNDGSASYSVPLRGPQGSAVLHVRATKLDGVWSFDELYVLIEDEDELRIELERPLYEEE